MTRAEIRLIIAKAIDRQERLILFKLVERFENFSTQSPNFRKEAWKHAPPLGNGYDAWHISNEIEHMSDGSLALIDIKLNNVSVRELTAKLNKH